jgi:K+/H+ antiporter YhaU regulatory subunit KhtT
MEIAVRSGDWVAGHSLADLRLRDEGVVVLGIERDGEYIGAPSADTVLLAGDTLVAYGRERRLCELDSRGSGASGEAAHRTAASEHGAAQAWPRA